MDGCSVLIKSAVELLLIYICLHLDGCICELTVNVKEAVVGKIGESVTLPCSYTSGNEVMSEMRWNDGTKNLTLYKYRKNSYDDIVFNKRESESDLYRYSRSGLNLVIRGFKKSDSGTRCCEILVDSSETSYSACTNLTYSEIGPDTLQCSHHDMSRPEALKYVLYVPEPVLRVTCTYRGVYPAADMVLYARVNGTDVALQSVSRHAAKRDKGLYTATMNINREIDMPLPVVFSVALEGEEDLSHSVTLHVISADAAAPVLVCHLPSWSEQRPEPYKFLATNVPAQYCTHIIWASPSTLHDNATLLPATVEEAAQLSWLVSLKHLKPGLKVLVSVRGAQDFNPLGIVAESSDSMVRFAASCLHYIHSYGLDGMDLTWKTPKQQQRDTYTQLLKVVRSELDSVPGTDYLLTVGIKVDKHSIEHSYDFIAISQIADLVNLMTFDLHGVSSSVTGLQAGLYPHPITGQYTTVDWLVRRCLERGLNPHKSSLGIPLHGRSFRLCTPYCDSPHARQSTATDSNCSTQLPAIGSAACGHGETQQTSQVQGILFYSELCRMLDSGEWLEEYDETGQAPFTLRHDQWITFENVQSVKAKAEYAKEKRLAGAMVWDVSQDDFTDACGSGKFPLVRSIAEGVGVVLSPPTTHGSSLLSVCFYPSSASSRPRPYTFFPEYVHPKFCTHVIWASVPVRNKLPVPATIEEKGQLSSLSSMRSRRPGLMVLVSVGGAGGEAGDLRGVLEREEDREAFAEACSQYVLEEDLDGIDLTWRSVMREEEMAGLLLLLQAVRRLFSLEYSRKLVLSVSLGADRETLENFSPAVVKNISEVVDLINLLTFDFHDSQKGNTGLHSGLYHSTRSWPQYSQDHVVQQYLSLGLDPAKTTLGIPLYGYSFRLCDPENTGIGAPACGLGNTASVSGKPGTLFYTEICIHWGAVGSTWTRVYDNASKGAYSYDKYQWVCHETSQTIKAKVSYVRALGLAGVMVWDISQDDFSDRCGEGTFPLMTSVAEALESIVMCYVPALTEVPPDQYSFTPLSLPPKTCTHLIWYYVTLANDSLPRSLEEHEKDHIQELVKLKRKNPKLKILASIGGKNSSVHFGLMTDLVDVLQFANSLLQLVQDNHLDGIDIAWFHPTTEQKKQFNVLLTCLHNTLHSNNYQLSVTLGGQPHLIEDMVYDLPQISKLADVVNLATFDLHKKGVTGHASGLYAWDEATPQLSQDWIVEQYLEHGLEASITTLAVPFHGRSFTLCSPSEAGLGAEVCDKGEAGPVSRESGILPYSEMCKLLRGGGWTVVSDPASRVPYSYSGQQWVSHENVHSVLNKMLYIQMKGLAGAMVWDVTQDDSAGVCGAGKYPLLTTIAQELRVKPKPPRPQLNIKPGLGDDERKPDENVDEVDNVDSDGWMLQHSTLVLLLTCCYSAGVT